MQGLWRLWSLWSHCILFASCSPDLLLYITPSQKELCDRHTLTGFLDFPVHVAQILLRHLASGTETGAQAGAIQIHVANAMQPRIHLHRCLRRRWTISSKILRWSSRHVVPVRRLSFAFCTQKTSKESNPFPLLHPITKPPKNNKE